MPKSATFLTKNLQFHMKQPFAGNYIYQAVFFPCSITSICIEQYYSIDHKTKLHRNKWQKTNFFLNHYSTYNVISPIKILLIRVNNTVSWLICFLKSCPTAKQAVAWSFLLPDHPMATLPCFFLVLAFHLLQQNRNLLACP